MDSAIEHARLIEQELLLRREIEALAAEAQQLRTAARLRDLATEVSGLGNLVEAGIDAGRFASVLLALEERLPAEAAGEIRRALRGADYVAGLNACRQCARQAR